MERTPAELRRLGLRERLAARPGLAGTTCADPGDAANDPGWAPDPDPRAKNRDADRAYLPRLADHVASRTRERPATGRPPARHRRRLHVARRRDGRAPAGAAGAAARARLVRRPRRLQHAGHDAVGQRLGHAVRDGLRARRRRTSSAAATARRSARRTRRCSAARCSTSTESRMLAASAVAQFGAGMLADPAGQAALRRLGRGGRRPHRRLVHRVRPGRARRVRRLGGGDARARRAVARDRARRRCGSSRRAAPVVGFGATAVRFGAGGDASGRWTRSRPSRRPRWPDGPADDHQGRGDLLELAPRTARSALSSQLGFAPASTRSPSCRSRPRRAPLPVAEGGRARVRAVRDAAVRARAEGALLQVDVGAARAPIGDLEPGAAGEPIAARLDEPALRQRGAVDGPVHRARDGRVELLVLGRAGAGAGGAAPGRGRLARRARRTARRSGSPRARRSPRASRTARPWPGLEGSALGLASASAEASGPALAAPDGDALDPPQALSTSARRAARTRKDRRRSGRSRPGALDRRRVTGGG